MGFLIRRRLEVSRDAIFGDVDRDHVESEVTRRRDLPLAGFPEDEGLAVERGIGEVGVILRHSAKPHLLQVLGRGHEITEGGVSRAGRM